MARRNIQASAPVLPVRTKEQLRVPFRSSEHDTETCGESERIAAELLDTAFVMSGLENKEIAHLCGVSESLVIKWRSADTRGCPSFVQMLRLPLSFQWALHKSMNTHFGFGTRALQDVLDAVGLLAAGMK